MKQPDLSERFGSRWKHYRREVRDWFPGWKPTSELSEGRLYVAISCDPCSSVGMWFSKKDTVNLQLCSAESHIEPLQRIRYESADGFVVESGIRAIAHGLEHINLGWAIVGWIMRLPIVAPSVQLVADAVGGGPRLLSKDVH